MEGGKEEQLNKNPQLNLSGETFRMPLTRVASRVQPGAVSGSNHATLKSAKEQK
jgi:hypothetical protein